MKVLFRTDAGPQIGLGHLQRCLSLATALSRMGAACLFLTNNDGMVRTRVAPHGFAASTLDSESWSPADLEQTLKVATEHMCEVVVVDSDCEGVDYLGQLRAAGFFVTAVEDMAPHPFPCQLVVNGDAHARQLMYRASSDDTRFLLGPEYCILRPEFWEVSRRGVREQAEKILVSLGGADRYRLMPMLLEWLDELPGTFTVTAIIGPFFDSDDVVAMGARTRRHVVRPIREPGSLLRLMTEADLAISAAGQTLYELAAVGTPTVAIRVADNQAGQLATLIELGVVQSAGNAEAEDVVATLGQVVPSLLQDWRTRAAMSTAGQRLVDGHGALRVAREILADADRRNTGADPGKRPCKSHGFAD